MINLIRGFNNKLKEDIKVSSDVGKEKTLKEEIKVSSDIKKEKTKEVIVEKEHKNIFYLKLTILNHENYIGKRIKLLEKGKLIWGNELERPQTGFPLEYRNIIVRSNNPSDFTLDIDIPNKIEISTNSFTTEQQSVYDKRFNITQNNDFFYSIRGNKVNPNKIIFTFPGFGPSTSRISYSVTAFQNIDSIVTENALIIAFQDRYQTAGTYMIEDNFGEELYPKFVQFVKKLKNKYKLEDKDLLFFGASKGGSIALMYMKDFKKSTLLISAPQVNLLYYWQSKAFFRNNLFHYFKNKIDGNLILLLEQYLNENRKIHYFYTHDDELSNYSFIETINGYSELHKYQVDGKHGEITKKAQATMENIIINFVSKNENKEIKKASISKSIKKDKKIYFQVIMDKDLNLINDIENNRYIVLNEYGTKHYIYLTNHSRRDIAYSNEMQYLDLELASISRNEILAIYFDKSGRRFEHKVEKYDLEILSEYKLDKNIVNIQNSILSQYKVIEKDVINEFNFIYFDNSPNKILHIKFVNMLPSSSNSNGKLLYIREPEYMDNINIFISRLIKKLKITNLNIVLEGKQFEHIFYLSNLDFPNLTFELLDPIFDSDDLANKITSRELNKFEKIYKSEKCIIKFINNIPNQYFKNLLI
ncbi:hypothetical protein [Clostridium sp.]|uniref:hypothetical protein n=1 Tax=Clostridium sp. TaxID=1506 RepID=UPI001EC7B516|nr:hypothetical protein [Clostridium sp.]MBS5886664.1 hypothetical protein [Clostridium sp.]